MSFGRSLLFFARDGLVDHGGLKMKNSLRNQNMLLLRSIEGGHAGLARKLKWVTSSTNVSKMAIGTKDVSEEMAERIRLNVGLPIGWFDRDNYSLIKTSFVCYSILKNLEHLPDDVQKVILNLTEALVEMRCQKPGP